ncbi:MAG TPA: TIGR02147 family protein [Fibrobacteria bacterium]|nr:TIGR02147 family protein [Fibrobacteria bacterium]
MSPIILTDIYAYLDYRKFLQDLYAEKKAKGKFFSYRYLAQKTGLKSAGFFTWVLQGKRNLSPHLVLKFAQAFKLNRQETGYFELLVSYNQARSHEERKHFFDRLICLKRTSAKLVDSDQYEFYEKWYYSAVRELIGIQPFKDDFAKLARTVVPAITVSEAKKAVELLDRLSLIVRDEDGYYQRKDSTISTGQSWKSLAIANFQIQSFDLGRQALDRFGKAERDMSTMTLSCSQATFDAIRERLKALRLEFAEMAKNDSGADRVLQCNFQVFPLSKPVAPGGSDKS